MKANRKYSKDEEAVSPVIGVILMVAITVILAAVIAAFVFNMGGSLKEAPPSISLTASSNSATIITDVVIEHIGGEDLMGSDWKVSVVKNGNNPLYVTSSSSDNFVVGTQLVIDTGETLEETYGFASGSWKYSNGSVPLAAGKYDVKIVHIPSNSMVLDTVIDLR